MRAERSEMGLAFPTKHAPTVKTILARTMVLFIGVLLYWEGRVLMVHVEAQTSGHNEIDREWFGPAR